MIILSGGGRPEVTAPIDAYFAQALDVGKPVLYIPLAKEPDGGAYEESLDWFLRVYAVYGIREGELCTDLRAASLDSRYGAVYIAGGDPRRLLREIRRTDFAARLRAYLGAGGILYGASAGAIVCGQTIEPIISAEEAQAGQGAYDALDLLRGHDVLCHYDPARHGARVEAFRRNTYLLYEGSGVALTGAEAVCIGKPFAYKRINASG